MLQVHSELQRRRGMPVPFADGEYDEAVARVRPQPERHYEFGVGATSDCQPGSGSFRDPRCYKYDVPLCNMATVPGSILAQAGQTNFLLQIEPIRSPYFEALACRMQVRDAANEDLGRSARLTAVHCNGEVRDTYDNTNPTAATTNFVNTDAYEVPDPYAIPVPWGVFGKINDNQALELTFWAEYNANVAIDVNVVIKGIALPPNHPRVLKQLSGDASSVG